MIVYIISAFSLIFRLKRMLRRIRKGQALEEVQSPNLPRRGRQSPKNHPQRRTWHPQRDSGRFVDINAIFVVINFTLK